MPRQEVLPRKDFTLQAPPVDPRELGASGGRGRPTNGAPQQAMQAPAGPAAPAHFGVFANALDSSRQRPQEQAPPMLPMFAGGPTFSDGDVGAGYPQTPYLPNPQQLDAVNRVQERSQDRQVRASNFYNSVQRNNQQASLSAGTFAAARAAGLDEGAARRQAYIATHPSAPQQGPAQAQPAAGAMGGGGGGGGGPQYVDPRQFESYHGGIMKQAMQEATAARRGLDRAAADEAMARYKASRDALNDFRAQRAGISTGGGNAGGASGDGGGQGMFAGGQVMRDGEAGGTQPPPPPTTQPSSGGNGSSQLASMTPILPPGVQQQQAGTQMLPPLPPGAQQQANPLGKAGIPITEEIAREMSRVIQQANPNADPRQHRESLTSKLGEYGVPSPAADEMQGRWSANGTTNTFDFQQPGDKPQPVPPTPQKQFAGGQGGRSGAYQLPNGQTVVVDASGQQVGGAIARGAPVQPEMRMPAPNGPKPGYTQIAQDSIPTVPSVAGNAFGRYPAPGGSGGQGQAAQGQPPQQQAGAPQQQQQGVPMQLRNGRTAFKHPNGDVTDEQGRFIVRRGGQG